MTGLIAILVTSVVWLVATGARGALRRRRTQREVERLLAAHAATHQLTSARPDLAVGEAHGLTVRVEVDRPANGLVATFTHPRLAGARYLPKDRSGASQRFDDRVWARPSTAQLATLDAALRPRLAGWLGPDHSVGGAVRLRVAGAPLDPAAFDAQYREALDLAHRLVPPEDPTPALLEMARADPDEVWARRALRALIDDGSPAVGRAVDSNWPSVRAMAAQAAGPEPVGRPSEDE